MTKEYQPEKFNDDPEGNGMAMSQLYAIKDKSMQLAEMLSTKLVGLEAWQQAKVTTASDEIGAVYDAVKYRGNPDTKKMLIAKSQGHSPDIQKEGMANATEMSNSSFSKFATFEKASPDQQIVVGYASSERVDGQNDIVDPEALNQALGDYMQWANLREMHQPKAVGKVLSATPIRGTIQLKDGTKLTNPLRIICQIVDSDTWEKVKTGVLKGFSIGGKVLQASTNKMNGKEVRRITGLQLHEISLVDRPANPDARIVLMKRDDVASTEDIIQKASAIDPSKILPQLQQLRNQAEMDGDLEQAERYNEVISLMLEAMGVIPQGTTRDVQGVESGERDNENAMTNPAPGGKFGGPSKTPPDDNDKPPEGMPSDMMNMDQVYAYNPAFQNTSNVAYAQMTGDLQKAGRTLSAATDAQLTQIMQAVQFIMQQIVALKSSGQPQGGQPQGGMPQGGMPQGGMPQPPADMSAVPSDQVPVQAESPTSQVQSKIVPQQPPSSLAPSPDTMSMLRGIGNPVLAAAQSIEDLKKGEVDITSIEKEINDMEQLTQESAPPMENMEGTEKAISTIDVDAITKSLTGFISAQLSEINKQMESMVTTAKEQHTSLVETVNPLTEVVNTTKAMVEPLIEKVNELTERLVAIENTPVGNTPVLRGTAVSKALGGEAAEQGSGRQMTELDTLYKMLDETKDPMVRTKLREQVAFAEAKNIFRR